MRRDIKFNSKGLQISGWLYVPDNLPGGTKAPTVIMAPGYQSTIDKPEFIKFSEMFMHNGFVTLAFDYRCMGKSEGEPRNLQLWYEQVDDYHNAISWVSGLQEVDPARIGLWGTSMSGQHVIWVSAYDIRVKAAVCQMTVPTPNWDITLGHLGAEKFRALLETINQDRIQRQKTGKGGYMPIYAPKGKIAAIPNEKAYNLMVEKKDPQFQNQVLIENIEKQLEYDVRNTLQRVTVPLLALLAGQQYWDHVENDKKLFEQVRGPKSINIFPCTREEIYNTEPWFSKGAELEAGWFKKYL